VNLDPSGAVTESNVIKAEVLASVDELRSMLKAVSEGDLSRRLDVK
jgi:hypothetical protein